MGKTKQGQDQDQVETKDDPAAKAVGPVPAAERNAAQPHNKEIGLRSQGDVAKDDKAHRPTSEPASKTKPAAAEGESDVARDRPGNLRSQGAVALANKTDAPVFSNVHMRSELAKKAGMSTPEQPKVVSAAPKGGPASKEIPKGKSQSAANASDLDATLPEAHGSTRPPIVAEKTPSHPKNGGATKRFAHEEKIKMVKAPLTVAPKSDVQVVKAEPLAAPKSEATLEAVAPIISLKVAVKMDKATLVMNPKSDVTLDDAEAAKAPKSDVKPQKVAPSIPPRVQVKKDKATPVMDPKSALHAAKAAPASAPEVGVKSDTREAVTASKTEAKTEKATVVTADAPAAPEPSVEPAAKSEMTSSEGDDMLEGGMDLSEAEGDDLQDTTQRSQRTGSLSERRHRRTRELRTHREATAEKRA